MKALIGDIGNTITKVSLIDIKNFKVTKTIYFDSKKIFSDYFLKNNLKKIIKNKSINKIALFSSVVPKYQKKLQLFMRKFYKISLKEIKENKLKKIV